MPPVPSDQLSPYGATSRRKRQASRNATSAACLPGATSARGPPDEPSWIELQRVAPLAEASRLSGLSIDTLKRRHADKIVRLSPRRLGMRVKDALLIGS